MQGILSRRFPRSWWGAGWMALVLVALPAAAGAVATEPPIPPSTTGETVPKPSPTAEISVVTSRGSSAPPATQPALVASRGALIDHVRDARTPHGTVTPRC